MSQLLKLLPCGLTVEAIAVPPTLGGRAWSWLARNYPEPVFPDGPRADRCGPTLAPPSGVAVPDDAPAALAELLSARTSCRKTLGTIQRALDALGATSTGTPGRKSSTARPDPPAPKRRRS